MTESLKLKFIPLNFSWVALNPKPKGVIFFIGGAFFGTFPTLFYRYLLKNLFLSGYTIVALPYRFTFRHWSVAVNLVKDQVTLQQAMRDEAKYLGYHYAIYEEDPTEEKENYFWLGHSLGCKYIALLELLSDLEEKPKIQENICPKFISSCISVEQQKHLEEALADVDLEKISLKNQKSILMAPAIEGLEGAIPILREGNFPWLRRFLNNIGIKVEPSQKETFCLIEQSRLFGLTSLISFKQDTRIAAPTVKWLLKNLVERLLNQESLQGGHLAPLGWISGDYQIFKTVEDFLPSVEG